MWTVPWDRRILWCLVAAGAVVCHGAVVDCGSIFFRCVGGDESLETSATYGTKLLSEPGKPVAVAVGAVTVAAGSR